MNLKSVLWSATLLLGVVSNAGAKSLPEYTLRRRRGSQATVDNVNRKEGNKKGRRLDEGNRQRSMAYRNCGGKAGSKAGKGGKDGKDGGKGSRRALDGCLDYGDPLDDPEYFEDYGGMTGDDNGPLNSNTGDDGPPYPAPVPAPVAPPIGPPPTPGVGGIHDDSGSNEVMDVYTDYEQYEESGSNDGMDAEDEPEEIRTGGSENAGMFISIPGPAADEATFETGDGDGVPSNDVGEGDQGIRRV